MESPHFFLFHRYLYGKLIDWIAEHRLVGRHVGGIIKFRDLFSTFFFFFFSLFLFVCNFVFVCNIYPHIRWSWLDNLEVSFRTYPHKTYIFTYYCYFYFPPAWNKLLLLLLLLLLTFCWHLFVSCVSKASLSYCRVIGLTLVALLLC